MVWLSKTAGHVCRLGYLWCVACKAPPQGSDKTFADTYPTCEERCEMCDRVLADVCGREKEQTS